MSEEETKSYKRPSWDDYFLGIMESIAMRGTCDRGRSGCVIAKDKQLISAGYVGSAMGDDHCDDVGHLFQKRYNADGTYSMHCVRTVHAEQNAICQAAKRGVSVDGATLYCKMTPCPVCAKMIVNCGIKRVVCLKRYHDGKEAERVFAKSGVALIHINEDEEAYDNKGSEQNAKVSPAETVEAKAEQIKIKLKKLSDDVALPTYAYQNDAGMDLYANEDIEIPAGSRAKVGTGVALELPNGYAALIWDKSGVSVKKGLKTLGGVIDSDYRGEYIVAMANISKEPVNIQRGEKIAQVLIQKVEHAKIEISEELSSTDRGEGGFGSSDLEKIDPLEDSGFDYIPDDENLEEEKIEELEEGQDGKSRW